jgi:hypothetical protein
VRQSAQPGAGVHRNADVFWSVSAGERVFVADVPDGDELVEAAARAGYVHWEFRPTWCGLWKDLAVDVTLSKGGYRNPRCPLAAHAYEPGGARTIVFQLGGSEH